MKISQITPVLPVVPLTAFWPGTDPTDNDATVSISAEGVVAAVLSNLSLPYGTGLISVDSITVEDNEVTVTNALYEIGWNEVGPVDEVLEVVSATEGFYRIDLIVGDAEGTLSIVQGVEDDDNPVQPPLPTGNALIGIVYVYGEDITPIVPPILTSSEGQFLFYSEGNVTDITWNDKNTYRWANTSGNTLTLNGVYPMGEYLYDGRLFSLVNKGAGVIRVMHGTGTIPFNMPDALDLFIKQNDVAVFKYSDAVHKLELISVASAYTQDGKTLVTIGGADTNTLQSNDLIGVQSIEAIATSGGIDSDPYNSGSWPGLVLNTTTGEVTIDEDWFFQDTAYIIFYKP